VRFGVLGPLYAAADSQVVGLGGPTRRRLLAALLARAPEAASAHALVKDVWGETAPASAARTLHSHVARLRAAFGADGRTIETVADGYRIVLGREDVDAWVSW
jgi:DNA-binding SARP family transcriptional activator